MNYVKKNIIFKGVYVVVVFMIIFLMKMHKNTKVKDLSLISSGDSQVIAILDSGFNSLLIDENKNKIIKAVDVNKSSKFEDEIGHGTALTTLLLGSNSMKLNGLLPNVKIIIIKVTDKNGKCTFENLLKGLEIAEENEADIINISLGGDIYNESINAKIQELYRKNITIVSSAGDYSDKDLLFPANLSTVISVASINDDYNISEFSNYNKNVVCCFQGERLNVITLRDNKLEKTNELYGTSYSTIYASAYVASIRDYAIKHNIDLSNDQILKIMKQIDPFKCKNVITDINKIFKSY